MEQSWKLEGWTAGVGQRVSTTSATQHLQSQCCRCVQFRGSFLDPLLLWGVQRPAVTVSPSVHLHLARPLLPLCRQSGPCALMLSLGPPLKATWKHQLVQNTATCSPSGDSWLDTGHHPRAPEGSPGAIPYGDLNPHIPSWCWCCMPWRDASLLML